MKPAAAYALSDPGVPYSARTQQALAEILDFEAREEDCEIILSGWGAPLMDKAYLERRPNLKAVFYAAGSVRGFVTPEFWKRDILLCSAWQANARPVAEFTVAQIVLALKHTFTRSRAMHLQRRRPPGFQSPGALGSTVGLVGLGAIGQLTAERLQGLEVSVLAADPLANPETAQRLGVELTTLDELFHKSDVVSLHAPAIPSTLHLVDERLLRAMKPLATLINTSRGSLVDESALVRVWRDREDLTALLDVTEPEPPEASSPLYDLPNVVLTPHIAGSVGNECWRMGDVMLSEVRRFLQGQPPLHRMDRDAAERMT